MLMETTSSEHGPTIVVDGIRLVTSNEPCVMLE